MPSDEEENKVLNLHYKISNWTYETLTKAMIRRILYISLFLLLSSAVFAQQEPQFSQYMFNIISYNPGFAGARDAICGTGFVRQQWTGFEDADGNNLAPEDVSIALDAPLKILRGGVSLNIMQDQLGFEQSTGLKIGYAYRFLLGYGEMGIGARFGFTDYALDFSKLETIDSDPLIEGQGSEGTMAMDFGFGAYYEVPNSFYIGVSTTRLSQTTLKLGKADPPSTFNFKRHYFLNAGYRYLIPGKPDYEVLPSVLIYTDGVKSQYNVSGLLRYKEKFWGGLNYRYQDAISVLLGLELKDFRLGYSYDLTTSKLATAGSGSHEIMLQYCFKLEIEKIKNSYRNTRHL